MFCTNCGANNADGAKFCTTCGAPLGGSEAATAPQPQQDASQPPQSWPDYDDPQHGQNKKKSKKVVIVVAVVAVILAIIIAVVGLTMAGVISFGDGGSQETTTEEVDTSDKSDDTSKKSQDKDEDKKKESSKKSSSSADYLDPDFYDADPDEIQSSFEDLGFELSHTSAIKSSDESSDYRGTLYATFTGDVGDDLPGIKGSEIEITVGIDLTGDEDFTYDEYGMADDPVASLDELSDGCTVSYKAISYEADASKDKYASLAHDICNACSFKNPSYCAASDEELIKDATDEFDLSSDETNQSDDYIGDVLYISGPDWAVSVMGGDGLGGGTYVDFYL